jgi:1-hydroxycarotenoid 3,4-desaturase
MTTSRAPHVVVIGAGIGGLSAALALAHEGVAVTVLERAARPGGKLSTALVSGASLDIGPTVFTMRWVFDELFEQVGERLDSHISLTPLSMLARHSWSATERLDLWADIEQSAAAIAELSGAAEAQRFRRFCARARQIYETLETPFIRAAKPSLAQLAASALPGHIMDLWRITPFRSLWATLGDYFHDPRLRQLFGRYATYCGGSPWRSPATLMLVAHVEQSGVWSVDGGMHRIARALADMAMKKGAEFRYDTGVSEIVTTSAGVSGVTLASGEFVAADIVVSNVDCAALASGLFGADVVSALPPQSPSQRSLSALTLALVGSTDGFPLHRHNVFFSDNYAMEFSDIEQRACLPVSPTVYVCAQDRGDACASPSSQRERLFCIVNAPANGDKHRYTVDEAARCEAAVFALLTRHGLQIQRDPGTVVRSTPNDYADRFPGTGGALYGRAPHGWLSSFQRPGVRSKLPGLYLAGGSTHPGPGVSMSALSGHMAARQVLKDLR